MKKQAKKKRGKAESGSSAINFDKGERKRLVWLQKRLAVRTVSAVVRIAVAALYEREKALQKVGRLAQGLRGELANSGMPVRTNTPLAGFCGNCGGSNDYSTINAGRGLCYCSNQNKTSPADALQSDIRNAVNKSEGK